MLQGLQFVMTHVPDLAAARDFYKDTLGFEVETEMPGFVQFKPSTYLPDDLKAELERTAEETGRSEADLIREGVRLALTQHLPPTPHTGIFDSGDSRPSERVDDLLRGFGTR